MKRETIFSSFSKTAKEFCLMWGTWFSVLTIKRKANNFIQIWSSPSEKVFVPNALSKKQKCNYNFCYESEKGLVRVDANSAGAITALTITDFMLSVEGNWL